MSTVAWFRDLATNNQWANQRVYAACARLSSADIAAPRTSFFGSILRTLAHVAIVDAYYLDGLEGGGRGRSVFEDLPELEASFEVTRARQRDLDRRLVAYLEGAADAELVRTVGLPRRDGLKYDRAGDILLHLFLHQVHHRGQVHAMLSGTPVPPPQLDEFFLANERPTALAELAATRATDG